MTDDQEKSVRQLANKGSQLTPAEMYFCSTMLDKYPGRYREIYREVRAARNLNNEH